MLDIPLQPTKTFKCTAMKKEDNMQYSYKIFISHCGTKFGIRFSRAGVALGNCMTYFFKF